MNRRKFLSTLIGGVAATAAVRTFPFRVFSFPKEIEFTPLFYKVEMSLTALHSFVDGEKLTIMACADRSLNGVYFYNSSTGLLTKPVGSSALAT